jgi:transcriptional antiterminator NusG
MAFFAVQIWTGSEGKFLSLARKKELAPSVRMFWPRRNLRIRRRGVWRDSLAPIFPSYVFIQSEALDPELYYALKRTSGFIRFLPSNESAKPMDKKDQDLLTHFLSFGEIVDRSLVSFDENKRIRVLSGPLKGLEGRITKVDRRKGRAKVRLELYADSFDVDFGFEVMEALPNPPAEVENGDGGSGT